MSEITCPFCNRLLILKESDYAGDGQIAVTIKLLCDNHDNINVIFGELQRYTEIEAIEPYEHWCSVPSNYANKFIEELKRRLEENSARISFLERRREDVEETLSQFDISVEIKEKEQEQAIYSLSLRLTTELLVHYNKLKTKYADSHIMIMP